MVKVGVNAAALEVVPTRDATLIPKSGVGKQGGDGPAAVDGPLHRLVVEARDQLVQALPAGRVDLNVLPIQGASTVSGAAFLSLRIDWLGATFRKLIPTSAHPLPS